MKTKLKARLRTSAQKAHTVAKKAYQKPISSILSLCLLAGVAATLITFSQTTERSAPELSEIDKDWDKQPSYGGLFLSEKETPSYYKHIWYHTAYLLEENLNNTGVIIHAVHPDANPPYAVILSKKRVRNAVPFIAAIPKEMFTEKGWENIKKARLSEFATNRKYEIPSSPTMRLPIIRTLTSNEGKTIDGTVLSKSESAVVYQRKSDNKKVTIPFDKLSEDDKKWIQQTSNRRPRLLALIRMSGIEFNPYVIQGCLDANYDITFSNVKDKNPDLTDMTPEEIQSFDIIWRDRTDYALPSEKDQFKGVILTPDDMRNKSHTSKLEKGIVIDGRTVIYEMSKTIKNPEHIKEAVAAAIKMAAVK